jgi:hypothetical protein
MTPAESLLTVYVPKWTESTYAGTALRDVPTLELERIGVRQRDRGGSRAVLLVQAIVAELGRRKEEPA